MEQTSYCVYNFDSASNNGSFLPKLFSSYDEAQAYAEGMGLVVMPEGDCQIININNPYLEFDDDTVQAQFDELRNA